MEKTIKYLENGEYHYATVRSVGDLAQLKTNSKETLVEAINELWNGGGNADLSKAPKPEGYDQLVQDVADAVKNQQEISQQWIEWQNEEAQLTEERKQAYLQAMKEMQEAIDKAKADAAALDDKTTKLDEQITKTFSDLDTSIQNMHEQLQKEADRMDQELIDTKSDLTKVRTDLQNAQLDNGRIHDELTNINGKFEHKVWQTDLDPLKEQIDRAETSVQQTKDELLGKASRQDLDTVTNTVSKLDTQLKETAKGVEISVKKDELGGEIAEALTNKTNILLGTRRFTTNNWIQRDHVEICSDPWKGFLVAKQNSPIEGIQQAYDVKAGTTYTFSLFAKMDTLDDSNKPQIILAKNNLDTSLDTKIDVWRKEIDDITSDFKRYDLTFTPSEDCTIYPHVISNSNNPIFVCGYQLEIGKISTPWEPNQEDVGDYVEKSEAQFNVYNDKIQALTEKQRQQGDTQEKLRTEVTQTAEGTRQVSENLKKTNDDITKLRGEFEVKADHMKSEYETYTNKAIGQISDSTLNLIRNSSFQNKDEDFDQWQNISAKANVRSDENGLRWVELTQSGLTTNNPEGITSNYFNIKQGKVTVAVDIKSGDKASLDNESVLSLELYNDVKKRVDFYDVSLSQLGLSKELLGDHKVHRGLYRLGIDRNDTKYMTVKAKLVKNGDLYFTNFSARLSSIDDGAYEPNPDDLNQQILKQNTKIEQNAKEVAIKANSVDVTRDIKSAVDNVQVGTNNLLHHSDTFDGWFKGSYSSISTEKYLNGKIAVLLPNMGDGGAGVNTLLDGPYDDQPVTWTVYAKSDNNGDKLHTELWGGGGFTNQPLTTEWKKYQFSGQRDSRNHGFYFWGCSNNKGNIYISLPFATVGNKSGTWGPNSQDTSDEIKSAKDAAIQVASGQINLRVNELSTQFDDRLNKRINEQKTASEKFTSDGIEQVVTKITNVKGDVDRLGDTVGNLEVGGRNLLIGTSEDELSGKSYNFADYQISGGLQPNKTYTLSGWARVDQDSLNHHQNVFVDAYSEDWSWSVTLNINSALTSQYNKITFTTPNGKQLHPYVTVYLSHPDGGTNGNNNDAISGKAYIKKLKLEEGNFATDYTHAPEDINKKIDTQVLDAANIDELKTQGHYFVKNLTGNPIGGWVYVDVTGNNNDRIRQDVYQDNGGKHMSRRLFGNSWSGWEQGAYISDVNNVKTEVTASVKNLGDRVITQVNSVETKVDNLSVGGRNYISPKNIKGYYAHEPQYNASTQEWTVVIDNGTGGAWGGGICFQGTGIVVPWGQAYTDSVEVYVTDSNLKWNVDTNNSSIAGASWNGNDNDNRSALTATPALNSVIPTSQWYRLSVTAWNTNPKNTNHVGINDFSGFGIINNTGHTVTVKFRRPKQELGSKVTDWSPNPDDTIEAIKEVNTKWDVANGQIQGKVTESQVNNILNGKGYATQSWAETMFQMKKNSITLQAVRDNITNGIQNQVNDTRNQINGLQNQFNTQTGINLLKGTADFSGPWFNKNGKGWSCNGEWQPPTSENKSERNNNVVYQDSGHAWDGLGQTVELNTGEYTFSMWMWPTLSGNESMNIYVGDSQYGGTAKVNYSGYSYSASQPQNRWILVKTYLTVTQGGKLSIRPELNQASGTIHVASYMLQHGHVENPVWAPAPDDLAPKSIISSINITPDQIKIASNKIVIDGNTDIHGDLRTDRVRLVGKNGAIDMTGDTGIKLTNNDGSSMLLGRGNIDLMYKNDFRMNIDSSLMTIMQRNQFTTQKNPIAILNIGSSWNHSNNQIRGADIRYNPGNVNDVNLHGADYLALSYNKPNLTPGEANIKPQLVMAYQDLKFDENHYLWRKGVNVADDLTIQEYQRINVGYRDKEDQSGKWTNDPLMIHRMQWSNSYQADRYQPTIRLGYSKDSMGHAGVTFLWDQVKPFGDRDISDLGSIWFNGQRFVFGWASHKRMFGNQQQPAFMRLDDKGEIMSGIAFTPGSTWDLGSGAWNITASVMNNGG